MKIYRIKNLKTGLFSKGGSPPRWSKSGKIWKKPHQLLASVAWCKTNPTYYKDCIVIEYELFEQAISRTPVETFSANYIKKREVKEAARIIQEQEHRVAYEKKQLAELKAKYEGKE